MGGIHFPVRRVSPLNKRTLTHWALWAWIPSTLGLLLINRVMDPPTPGALAIVVLVAVALATCVQWLGFQNERRFRTIEIGTSLLKAPILLAPEIRLEALESVEKHGDTLYLRTRNGFTRLLDIGLFENADDFARFDASLRQALPSEAAQSSNRSLELERRRLRQASASMALMLSLAAAWFLVPLQQIVDLAALDRSLIREGEFWRLITYSWVHLDGRHLLFNVVSLGLLGSAIEGILGSGRYLTIYACGVIAGGVATFFLGIPGTFTVGASGGGFALIGALVVVVLDSRFPLPARSFRLPPWVFLGLVGSMLLPLVPKTDIAAHLGGFVFGILVTLVTLSGVREPSDMDRFHWPTVTLSVGAVGTLMVATAHLLWQFAG
ncbi:MAG: rhomboid family intramembrane serine protease [Gammaproteobacteria bacterium]|nr:rhomboid family intramembrane serine protease [Gammaproteobacteria bacterium]